jgi:hypothetical protein
VLWQLDALSIDRAFGAAVFPAFGLGSVSKRRTRLPPSRRRRLNPRLSSSSFAFTKAQNHPSSTPIGGSAGASPFRCGWPTTFETKPSVLLARWPREVRSANVGRRGADLKPMVVALVPEPVVASLLVGACAGLILTQYRTSSSRSRTCRRREGRGERRMAMRRGSTLAAASPR